jgi:hypothetical protein
MLKQKFAIFLGLFVAMFGLALFSASPVFALNDPAPNNGDTPKYSVEDCKSGNADPTLCAPKCQNSSDCNITKKYINPFINKFLAPLALLSVIIGIIWGSIEYSTAAGDPKKVAIAKGKIQKALTALVAFMFLWAFLQWLLPGGLI